MEIITLGAAPGASFPGILSRACQLITGALRRAHCPAAIRSWPAHCAKADHNQCTMRELRNFAYTVIAPIVRSPSLELTCTAGPGSLRCWHSFSFCSCLPTALQLSRLPCTQAVWQHLLTGSAKH